jgi:hypothetical protein
VFCPLCTIYINVIIRRLPPTLFYKTYLLIVKRSKVTFLGTNQTTLVWFLTVLDLFNICWAFTGIILSTMHNIQDCLQDFGYLAYIGIVFIVLSMLAIPRMIYMVAVFVYGKRICEHYERQQGQIDQVQIKFNTLPYQKKTP